MKNQITITQLVETINILNTGHGVIEANSRVVNNYFNDYPDVVEFDKTYLDDYTAMEEGVAFVYVVKFKDNNCIEFHFYDALAPGNMKMTVEVKAEGDDEKILNILWRYIHPKNDVFLPLSIPSWEEGVKFSNKINNIKENIFPYGEWRI